MDCPPDIFLVSRWAWIQEGRPNGKQHHEGAEGNRGKCNDKEYKEHSEFQKTWVVTIGYVASIGWNSSQTLKNNDNENTDEK